MAKKKTVINDGQENAREKQNLDTELRMPKGIKKPKHTPK